MTARERTVVECSSRIDFMYCVLKPVAVGISVSCVNNDNERDSDDDDSN